MKSRQLLTFNDINNYAKLRAATIKSFDRKLVDNMIFYYRTQEEEIINKLKTDLGISGFDFVPSFDYNQSVPNKEFLFLWNTYYHSPEF